MLQKLFKVSVLHNFDFFIANFWLSHIFAQSNISMVPEGIVLYGDPLNTTIQSIHHQTHGEESFLNISFLWSLDRSFSTCQNFLKQLLCKKFSINWNWIQSQTRHLRWVRFLAYWEVSTVVLHLKELNILVVFWFMILNLTKKF